MKSTNHYPAFTPAGGTYAYDPLGRRETKTVGSTVTNFLNDGSDILAEYDQPTGNVLRRYVPGPTVNDPIAYEDCTGATAPNCTGSGMVTKFYHTDHHGSVVTMSGSNGNPDTTEGPDMYDPFGNATMSNQGQPFRYVGMYYDNETGLYADRARVYSTPLGRFLQTDPVGYKDDLDLYTYVGYDPTDKVDPTGMDTWALGGAASFDTPLFTVEGNAGVALDNHLHAATYVSFGGGSVVSQKSMDSIRKVFKAPSIANMINAVVGVYGDAKKSFKEGGVKKAVKDSVSATAQFSHSNADTVGGLEGPFANINYGLGLDFGGTYTSFSGTDSTTGAQVKGQTFGAGLVDGLSSSVTRTNTWLPTRSDTPAKIGTSGCIAGVSANSHAQCSK